MPRPNEFQTNNQEHEAYSDNVSEFDPEGKEHAEAHQEKVIGDGGEQYNDTENAPAETTDPRPREYTTNGQDYELYRDEDEPTAVNDMVQRHAHLDTQEEK